VKNFTKTGFLLFVVTLSLAVFSQESKFTISPPPAELGFDSWRVPDEANVKLAQVTKFIPI
jgi:hypothetical protein